MKLSYNSMKWAALAAAAVSLVSACTTDSREEGPERLSRDEARALDGKLDGTDVCELFDWYGDEICDEFCPEPDPDCEGACTEDGDCPQIVCVRAPCPSSVCEAGQCVIEAPGCASDEECGENRFCAFEQGVCGGEGECADVATICPRHVDPVCGCNGRTYGNRCGAGAAGTSVDYEGPCGLASEECAEGETFCSTCNGNGICTPIGNACPAVYCGPPPSECDAGEHFCSTCFGNGVCTPNGTACPEVNCGPVVGCAPSGCSGQVCAPIDLPIITTCEWRPEYACYASAACERQEDGRCGWTETPALTECIEDASL